MKQWQRFVDCDHPQFWPPIGDLTRVAVSSAGIFSFEESDRHSSLWRERKSSWVSKNATRGQTKKATPVSHQGARGRGPVSEISAGISPFLSLRQRRSRPEELLGHPLTSSITKRLVRFCLANQPAIVSITPAGSRSRTSGDAGTSTILALGPTADARRQAERQSQWPRNRGTFRPCPRPGHTCFRGPHDCPARH